MSRICDKLQGLALLVPADPELAALAQRELRNDVRVTNRIGVRSMDDYLAQRLVLAPAAKQLLSTAERLARTGGDPRHDF
ncbi:MAG: hypothetical protein ACOY0T_17390 [Myxococcota bacterium]